MIRNPTWSRDELILALDLYMLHRERLPDSDAPEIVELSRVLNSLFGETAHDAALFRNPNGVYMKLANFRAVDPLHTSQGILPTALHLIAAASAAAGELPPGFARLSDIAPSIVQDMRYAGPNNFTGSIIERIRSGCNGRTPG